MKLCISPRRCFLVAYLTARSALVLRIRGGWSEFNTEKQFHRPPTSAEGPTSVDLPDEERTQDPH